MIPQIKDSSMSIKTPVFNYTNKQSGFKDGLVSFNNLSHIQMAKI